MTLTIEEAIARVPFLAEARDIKKTALGGGITNFNYKVEYDHKSCVIRITGANTELLGIRRDVEYAANRAAGELGIAPEVLFFIEPEGYLVTRFITGKRLSPEEITKDENIVRVARKLRLFHTRAPQLEGEFNVFRRVEMLTNVSREHKSIFPFDFDWIMQKMGEVEDALMRNPYILSPCHNDLLNLNWLDEDVAGELGEIKLLDWEYAGMNDIFYDLGNFAHHHRLSDGQCRLLLQAYFGEATTQNFAHLKLMWPMSEIHEAMWGTTQSVISTLEEDFQSYADLWFARVRQHITDPRWDQWLKDVTRDKVAG
jgi:thiamine kinase-like enzyme